jgi:hypothetical protein
MMTAFGALLQHGCANQNSITRISAYFQNAPPNEANMDNAFILATFYTEARSTVCFTA